VSAAGLAAHTGGAGAVPLPWSSIRSLQHSGKAFYVIEQREGRREIKSTYKFSSKMDCKVTHPREAAESSLCPL
jgi:hypothetical protein